MDAFVNKLKEVGRSFFSATKKRPAIIAAILLIGLTLPAATHAREFFDSVVLYIGYAVQFFVELFGKLLVAMIDVLVKVAQYNDFANSDAVNIGWVVVRDLSNMLFIISLVIISFGTILQWEQYRYNRLLGKLIITAILVNFSKALALFLVDFSQVIMLTFVNAFKDVAAGNLTTAFGIRTLLVYAESSTSVDINAQATALIYALAIILILISLIVVLSLIVIFVKRIISLWVLIILSPIALISSVMPGGVGKFSSDWWSKFGKELFTGPALAFFLWLTFSVIFITSGGGTAGTATIIKTPTNQQVVIVNGQVQNTAQIQAVVSEVGSTKNLFNFIAAIVLLVHSMSIAREASGFAGKFASKMSSVIDTGGPRIIRGIGKTAAWTSRTTGLTGVAKRVGYTAADSMLAAGEKNKLILGLGNRFGVARGKLRRKRDAEADEQLRDLSHVNKDVLLRMSEGIPTTETGRSRQKIAMERLIDQGDADDLSEKARLRYRKLIGYSETPVLQNDGSYKLKRNALDQNGYGRMRKLLKEHMEFWMDGYDEKAATPHLQEAVMNKYVSEVNKLKRASWNSLDPDAIKQGTAPYMQGAQALWQGWREQFGLEPGDEAKNWPNWFKEMDKTKKDFFMGPAPATMDKWAGKKITPEQRAAYDQWLLKQQQLHEDEGQRVARKGKNMGFSDNDITPQEAAEYARQSRLLILPASTPVQNTIVKRMAGLSDEEKEDIVAEYEKYAEEHEEFQKKLQAGNRSPQNQGRQGSPLADRVTPGYEMPDEIDDITGADSLDRRIQTEQKRAAEKNREVIARINANFDKLGLSGAGYNAVGAEKERLTAQLSEVYRQQLEKAGNVTADQIEQRVKAFGDAIRKAERLAIANTARKGYTAGHVYRHENAHAEMDRMNSADQEKLFSTLSKERQDQIVDEISKQWNLSTLPAAERRKQAIEEYFTEGLANFGRSDAIGAQLDQELALAMKSKGVRFKQYQEQAMNTIGKSMDQLQQQLRQKETDIRATAEEIRKQEEEINRFLGK